MKHNLINERGRVYGRLYVLSQGQTSSNGSARWLCLCVCGVKKEIVGYELRRGETRSCGCLGVESRVLNLKKASS